MHYDLDIEKQIRMVLQKFKISQLKREKEKSGQLEDIQDEKLYDGLLKSEDGEAFRKQEAF